MRRSRVIAHRGFWLNPDEKNTSRAFARALSEGFGIETDVRDLGGDLVISHDPPQWGAPLAEEFFTQCAAAGGEGLLALNIKADGLYTLLARAAASAGLQTSRTFVFDMSVPDAREYRGGPFPVYERTSEYEPNPPLAASTTGVWVDNFSGAIDQVSAALKFLELGFSVAIVSPELHGRPHDEVWASIRRAGLHDEPEFALCTDRPDEVLKFFGETT